MATASKVTKGFKVSCPSCGEAEAVRIDLNDLTSCECTGCGDQFTPQAARARAAAELARWEAVCRWVELAGEAMADASAE